MESMRRSVVVLASRGALCGTRLPFVSSIGRKAIISNRCAFWAAVLLIIAPLDQAHSTPIANGGFESGLTSWTQSGTVFEEKSITGLNGHLYPYEGAFFAAFNFGLSNDGPLTQNVLSQDFLVPNDSVIFHWNRLQTNYVGNGGVTLQVAYTDLTAGGTEMLQDIDYAPNGSSREGDLPWRWAAIQGLVAGHTYHFEVRAGFSEGVNTDNGALIYALDAVFAPDCQPLLPSAGCRLPGSSLLMVKNRTVGPPDPDRQDNLVWKWLRGEPTSQVDFGVPTGTAQYTLCLYAGTTGALVADATVPPDPVRWRPFTTKGYKYKDGAGVADGIRKVVLKGSTEYKAAALVKGKGANLPDPSLPLALPVTAQLVNSQTGICWEATYDTAQVKRNDSGQFKAVTR